MASQIEIINLALRRIAAQPIQALDEGSEEANVVSDIFDLVYRDELRAHPYSWASATAELAQVSDETPPDFAYAFQLPADFLQIQQILAVITGITVYDAWEELYGNLLYQNDEWEIREGKLYTNMAEVSIKYTKLITDYSKLDSTFVDALAWRIAMEAAPSITTRADLTNICFQMYQVAINRARGLAGVEKRRRMKISREYLQARNYTRG